MSPPDVSPLGVRRHRVPKWPIPNLDIAAVGTNCFHVVVIGAGIGGLAVAALLAARGLKVLVLEKHHIVGGNCTSWVRMVPLCGGSARHGSGDIASDTASDSGRFVFDSGVQDISGLGERGPLRHLLRQLGAEDRLTWHRVRHQYWADGLRLEGALSAPDFIDNLCRQFPDEAQGVRAFFAEIHAVYRDMYADVERTGGVPAVPTPDAMMTWPESHPHAFTWMRRPFDEMLRTYFKSDGPGKMLRIMSEYVTEDPHCLSVGDMAPLFGYYFDGGYYPAGGAQGLPDLLATLVRQHGGTVMCNAAVDRILTENGRAVGVETAAGTRYFAPLTISNADVVATMTRLIDPTMLPTAYAQAVASLARGPTAVLLGLGLSTTMNLPARIFIKQDGLAFGIGNPSVLDPSLAPPGHSAVSLLCLLPQSEAAPWLARGDAYVVRKTAFCDRLIDAVANSVFADIRRHIVYRQAATPATFADFTGAEGGNIYGAARGGWVPPQRSPVPGLMLVGAGTDTGAGIEAVTVSATRAADAIRPPR